MCRTFFIVWIIGLSSFAWAGFGPFGPSTENRDDLELDEDLEKKANALGNYAWSVFLWMDDRPLEKSHGTYMARALEEWPESGKILRTLAAPYLQRRDHAGLVKVLQPIAAEHPDVLPLQVFLAMMCHAAGMRTEAIEVFEHVFFDLEHHQPLVVRELAGLYWGDGREDEVPKFLKIAGRKKDLRDSFVIDYAWALFYQTRAGRLEEDGDESEAEKSRRQAVEHARKAAGRFGVEQGMKSCENLLEILEEGEDYDTLAALLAKAALKFPRRRMEFLARQADALIRAGQKDEGLAILQVLNLEGLFNADLLAYIGRTAVVAGDVDLAVSALERALKRAPRSNALRLTYALILQHLGQPEKALKIMAGMSRMNARAYLQKAQILGNLDRWEEAEKTWQLAAATAIQEGRSDFEDAAYYLAGATIYDNLDKPEDCISAARRAVKLAPENPLAANFLGYSLADAGRELEMAEKLIDFALSEEPVNDAYLDSLAWVYFRQKRFPEAAEAMARCLKSAGDFVDDVILDHAGDIFAAIGARDLARAFWRQALLEEPENPETIRQKLGQ